MKQIPVYGKHGLGKYATVDDDDFEDVQRHKWWVNKDGYCYSRALVVGVEHKFYLHRFIMNESDRSIHIDHINDDKLDNRKENLRRCSNKQNVSKKRKLDGFTSVYKGVSWEKRVRKWRATIVHHYKQVHLGTYETEEDAALSYNNAAISLFGEYARLNQLCQTP